MAAKRIAKTAPSKATGETLGRRLARLRKERGYTQVELAEKMGTIQAIISDYERDKLRPNPEALVLYASALAVSADVILGIDKLPEPKGGTSNRRVLRRLQAIDKLSKRDQDALIRTIDAFLGNSSKAS